MCVTAPAAGLTSFFNEHAAVRSIRMRKHLTSGDFKGSIFLELDSPEQVQALMDKQLVHAGATLVSKQGKAAKGVVVR